MNYHLFQYPLPAPPELADLNAFLASQRVVSVTQNIVESSNGPVLVFVVQTTPSRSPSAHKSEPKVDYRAVLDDDQFAIFSRLRTERKKIAEDEGVPVYTIFTNAQLAEIAKRQVKDASRLSQIEGIGPARVKKYGDRILASLVQEA